MFYFKTRDAARAFATKTGRQVSDLTGTGRPFRWGVQVVQLQD